MKHVVKCAPVFFEALASGRKTFEFRKNDRGYLPGDILEIVCFSPNPASVKNRRTLFFDVTYVLDYGTLNTVLEFTSFPLDYVILGLSRRTGSTFSVRGVVNCDGFRWENIIHGDKAICENEFEVWKNIFSDIIIPTESKNYLYPEGSFLELTEFTSEGLIRVVLVPLMSGTEGTVFGNFFSSFTSSNSN
ncbi:MAG: DUF3850 domain-containing protein [Flammeovirgaceae bacterium]